MGLDYGQKQLLSIAAGQGKRRRATLSHMSRKGSFSKNLQVYAFWTGFASTLVSVIQMLILAFKK
jgi:hypothetical protein